MNKKASKRVLGNFYNSKMHLFLFLFCFVFAGTFLSVLFLHSGKSASLIYSENFTADTFKDINATTGRWDTSLGQANILGKGWTNMAETKDHADNISNNSSSSYAPLSQIDAFDNPYLIWYDDTSADIYFSKWTPAVNAWTSMDGVTLGYDNLSNTPTTSLEPDFKLDSAGNPYIIWSENLSGSGEIYFTKWTPAVNAWTSMDGVTLGYDNISNTIGSSGSGQIMLDSADIPYVVWYDQTTGNGDIYLSKWTPAVNAWTGMDGVTSSYDNISNNGSQSTEPQMQLDSANNPYAVWQDVFLSPEIYFRKWTVGAGPGVCGAGINDCWTKMDGTAGFDNVSNTASGSFEPKIAVNSLDLPYIIWSDSLTGARDIYFSKWTPAVGWTQMDGVTLGSDNLSNNSGSAERPFIKLDLADNPNVVWNDWTTGWLDIYFSKWTVGAGPGVCGGIINDCWTNMAGTVLGYDNLSNNSGLSSTTGFEIDGANNPYIVWDDSTGAPIGNIIFSKWTPAVNAWTKMDGVTLGYQIVASDADYGTIKLDSAANPYITWYQNDEEAYFAKWLPVYKPASIIQSSNINTYGGNVLKATLNATEILNGQTINYFLSNNGGVTWDPVALGVENTFTTIGGNLLWQAQLASGNPNITPIIDDLTIDYVATTSSGAIIVTSPEVPSNLTCQVQSPELIRWNFEDTASDETGFRLYGQGEKIYDTGDAITQDLSYIEETNLLPNTQYPERYVTTFNGAGESGASNTASCYTLANTPLELEILTTTIDSITLKINPADNNPPTTEYAIKELNSNQYINPDGTFSYTENWQDYEGWGGDNGIIISGEPLPLAEQPINENSNSNINAQFKISLTAGQTYNFAVKAKNGDGIETTFSPSTPPPPWPPSPPVPPLSYAPPLTPTPTPSPTPPSTPPPTPSPTPPPTPLPTPPVTPPTPPVTPPTPSVTPPATPPKPPLISMITESKPVKYIQEAVVDNPQVENVSQNVITPILLILAIVNTVPAVLALAISILPYLHLLFIEPLLLLFRKKRRKWGIVYDALNKLPVGLAVVRLYSKKDNKLVQTKVTDKEGRYLMIVKEPGRYYLSVTKPDYIFPTKYLAVEKQDFKYLDLYHGEEIEVMQKEGVVTANIPLDPREKKRLTEKEAIRSYLIKNLRLLVSYIGLILSILIILIYPTVITIGSLVIHIILFLLFRRLVVPPKPKSWGIVYDEKTKEPISLAIVRIFETRFNKLLETQVTDGKGRYAFLVGKNRYQLLTEKQGYQPKEIKQIDLIKKEEIVNLDINLAKS
jgi:hypothetical protein